jgi:DNA-binding NarL/FixJ family response regulator
LVRVQSLEEDRLAPIRILVVDDHGLVRRTLCGLVNAQPDMVVVCQASTGLQAVRKAEEYQPDVVLLDIGLPELNGIHASPLIKKVAPNAEILIVTQYEDQFFARQAFAAGARGYVTKAGASAELITAVKQVYSKKQFLSERVGRESRAINGDPSQDARLFSSE